MATEIYGTNGDDSIQGTPGDEIFYGLTGSDTINGNGGNDVFYAEGSWAIWGTDRLIGNSGNDTFYLKGGASTVITGTGMDKLVFGGSVISYGFTISDFDTNRDRLLVDGNFPIRHGESSSTLLEISATGQISANSVFIKISDTFDSPESATSVASKLFNLDTSLLMWTDAVFVIVGNTSKTVIWELSPDSIPKIQSDQLTHFGTLSSLPIKNFSNGVITYLSEYQEPTVAPETIFTSSSGNDTFDGSSGIDTVIFSGTLASHTLTHSSSSWTVSSAADGTDTLINIERLQFSDKTIALDIEGNAGQVYRLYQAAFNRMPDKGGLGDWIYGMDHDGVSLLGVAAGFINSPEFQSVYGANPTNPEIVTRFYQNVLHRDPEKAGFDYWMNQLESGLQTRTQVLTGFSESPENKLQVIGVIQNGIEYTPHTV